MVLFYLCQIYKKIHFCGHLAAQFNNYHLIIPHPDNYKKIIGHEDFDPNELARIEIPRTSAWIQSVLDEIFKEYFAYGNLWKMGTGGGSGKPENYTDWMKRDDKYLNDYTCKR